jgi:hypothetical protein
LENSWIFLGKFLDYSFDYFGRELKQKSRHKVQREKDLKEKKI